MRLTQTTLVALAVMEYVSQVNCVAHLCVFTVFAQQCSMAERNMMYQALATERLFVGFRIS